MSRQTFSRLPKPTEGYFVRRELIVREGRITHTNDPLLTATLDKELAFKFLAEYEKAGIPCYVENLAGERIS